MNTNYFLERIEEILPPGKPLTGTQLMGYREKLARFEPVQLDVLCEAVIENCKFWPKIADIYEQARLLGMLNRERQDVPHTWVTTDCLRCAGSGLVAAFWSQEFELGEQGKVQILRLHYLMPYYTHWSYQQQDHDDILFVHRCDCSAGEAKTLPLGVPRWRQDIPETIRRSWAA